MTDQAPIEESEGMRELRESRDANAQRAEDAEQRALAAERRAAFMESGLDVSDPTVRLFQNTYTGDASADAIRDSWVEAGFTLPGASADPEPEPAAAPPVDVNAGIDQITGRGAQPAGMPEGKDIVDHGYELMHDAQERGVPEDVAQVSVVQAIAGGAVAETQAGATRGTRFLYDRDEFHRRIQQ